uniref:Uncharacterized protein n=1 Tax=Arundo donax TaxID=35708 RepID=A0A0A9BFU9_ARUDO
MSRQHKLNKLVPPEIQNWPHKILCISYLKLA